MKKFIISIFAGMLFLSGSIYALPKGDTNNFCQSQGTSIKKSSEKKARRLYNKSQKKKYKNFKKGRY